MSVAAVVVTYNRIALLERLLQKLASQSRAIDEIIVVNNGSSDGTREWLEERQNLLTVIHQDNVGGAGGFFTGIKTAYEKGHKWIWCMDDDGYPAPDALEILLASPTFGPCVLSSVVIDIADHNRLAHPLKGKYTQLAELQDDYIIGGACPFNGTLFHRGIIQIAGLPIKELFIWGDELEYMARIKHRFDLPLVTVTKSHYFHPRFIFGFDESAEWPPESIWKTYYYFRNRRFILFNYAKGGKLGWIYYHYIKYIGFILSELFKVIRFQKRRKLMKVSLVLLAFIDAITKNLTKKPYQLKRIFKL